MHIDHNNKDILILIERQTQGLHDTTLTVEAIYQIKITQPNKRFVFSLHYNASNSFLFVKATKYINSKQNILK